MDVIKKSELEAVLKSAFSHAESMQIDSPIDLAQLGSIIRNIQYDFSFNYYGQDKLRPLLEEVPDIVELVKDDSVYPPRYFAKYKNPIIKDSTAPQMSVATRPNIAAIQEASNTEVSIPNGKLDDNVQVILDRWKELSLLALKGEDWGDDYVVLKNYINHTYYRLLSENKVKQNGAGFTFNTGLVDTRYQAIYANIEKNNKNGMPKPWFLSAFFCEGENLFGKELIKMFGTRLPEAAWYFNVPSDAIYNINAGVPKLDWQHILEEHPDRLPYELINRFATGFKAQHCNDMNKTDREKYNKDFASYLRQANHVYRLLKGLIESSVDNAIKQVRWNYKTAVPVYYPKSNKVNLLLPLRLLNDNIDLALVVEKVNTDNDAHAYMGHTIYPLDWAYSNARLIARPESSWLNN